MRFSEFGKRVVFAAFDGGEITTDAGVLLLREQARRIGLFERMAACFTDRRDPARALHALPALLAQRVAGIALGYEDINDHDALRHDPACKLLADCGGGSAPAGGKAPPALAGKSTLNRIEHAWDTGDRRYHQISANHKQLSNLFVTLFLDAHRTPPARITLDIDATDVETCDQAAFACDHEAPRRRPFRCRRAGTVRDDAPACRHSGRRPEQGRIRRGFQCWRKLKGGGRTVDLPCSPAPDPTASRRRGGSARRRAWRDTRASVSIEQPAIGGGLGMSESDTRGGDHGPHRFEAQPA